jgi:hypothetical protein
MAIDMRLQTVAACCSVVLAILASVWGIPRTHAPELPVEESMEVATGAFDGEVWLRIGPQVYRFDPDDAQDVACGMLESIDSLRKADLREPIYCESPD